MSRSWKRTLRRYDVELISPDRPEWRYCWAAYDNRETLGPALAGRAARWRWHAHLQIWVWYLRRWWTDRW